MRQYFIILIFYIYSNNFSITRFEFLEVASAIVDLFPTELMGTYFVPSVRNTQAHGKLHTVYNKYKLQLREVGLITVRAKAPAISNSEIIVTGLFFFNMLFSRKNGPDSRKKCDCS